MEKSISSITLNYNDIATIVRNLDPKKAHGHDIVSIRMLKICGKLLCKPLKLIFQSWIKHGKFPNEWKMANVVPFLKKGNKQILKNYRPVSLLPICGKIFERLIYNIIFEDFIENDLISLNWYGLKLGDSRTSRPTTCNFIKKDWRRSFLVNFAKFSRTPFLQNTFRRVFLAVLHSIWKPVIWFSVKSND